MYVNVGIAMYSYTNLHPLYMCKSYTYMCNRGVAEIFRHDHPPGRLLFWEGPAQRRASQADPEEGTACAKHRRWKAVEIFGKFMEVHGSSVWAVMVFHCLVLFCSLRW